MTGHRRSQRNKKEMWNRYQIKRQTFQVLPLFNAVRCGLYLLNYTHLNNIRIQRTSGVTEWITSMILYFEWGLSQTALNRYEIWRTSFFPFFSPREDFTFLSRFVDFLWPVNSALWFYGHNVYALKKYFYKINYAYLPS